MTEELIKHMVDRFLGWKLPENFSPDAGITFDPYFNNGRGRHEPSGTNLFDAQQAEEMVRYMVEGYCHHPKPGSGVIEERVTDEYLRRPEVTVGFAMVGPKGDPYPSTVNDTKRAAMVNALASIFGQMAWASESDSSIKRRFSEACGTSGMRISPVLIESVEVTPDEESKQEAGNA